MTSAHRGKPSTCPLTMRKPLQQAASEQSLHRHLAKVYILTYNSWHWPKPALEDEGTVTFKFSILIVTRRVQSRTSGPMIFRKE